MSMNFTLIRQNDTPRVYSVYYLRYLDQLVWLLKRKTVRWTPDGRLCHIVPAGKNFFAVECHTHFPNWFIIVNIRVKLFFIQAASLLVNLFKRK